MTKKMYGPQVIIETNDYLSSSEKAEEWNEEVVAYLREKYPNVHIDTNIFYMEK